MTLGQRIQELRKKAGLSQEALGAALGVSRQAVSKWEGDNGIPELDTLIAMSRLFGVTLGALLGVEAPPAANPEDAGPAPPGLDEERLEAVLRRCAEETENRRPTPRFSARQRKWILAVVCLAVGVLLFFGIRAGERLSELRRQVSMLSGRLSSLEQTMDSRNAYLTERIAEILEEQNALLSAQNVRLTGLDPEKETVTAELSASLKAYTPGTQAQFICSWTLADGTSGKTESGWVDGPAFSAQVELPMNIRTELLLRLRDAEGVIQETQMEPQFGLEAENLALEVGSLTALFAVSAENAGWTTVQAEEPGISISSPFPQLFVPETAHLTAQIDGELLCDWELELTAGEAGRYTARNPAQPVLKLTLQRGDWLTVSLTVTDSLGRTQTFEEQWTTSTNGLEQMPKPAVPIDTVS